MARLAQRSLSAAGNSKVSFPDKGNHHCTLRPTTRLGALHHVLQVHRDTAAEIGTDVTESSRHCSPSSHCFPSGNHSFGLVEKSLNRKKKKSSSNSLQTQNAYLRSLKFVLAGKPHQIRLLPSLSQHSSSKSRCQGPKLLQTSSTTRCTSPAVVQNPDQQHRRLKAPTE